MDISYLNSLLNEGKQVLATTHNNSRGSFSDYDRVNREKFTKWQTKLINYFEKNVGADSYILKNILEKVKNPLPADVENGLGIIKSQIEDIEFSSSDSNISAVDNIELILTRFSKIVHQLRDRERDREPLLMNDEYDIQYLLNALLKLYFDDVRPEEWTPSYAGSSNRMDFLIKDCFTVIETKMTRKGLKDKKLGEELTIDIANYVKHVDCKSLYCFVYDPEQYIKNPSGLKNDLEQEKEIEVHVIIVN